MITNEKILPERLDHLSIPGEIIVAYEPLHIETTGGDRDRSESITGTLLLKKMAEEYMDDRRIDVYTPKNEKPKAYIDGEEVSASFSHTDDAIVAAISTGLNVGIDMEHAARMVKDRLASRMQAPGESNSLYESHPLIRVWTFKEAALKMIGTGLRKPMNQVAVHRNGEFTFNAQFDDGKKAKICSFSHEDHWISICYHKLP